MSDQYTAVNKYHNCYNRCGECRHSTEDENNLYRCAKRPEFIGSFQDTSDCKDFEGRSSHEPLRGV